MKRMKKKRASEKPWKMKRKSEGNYAWRGRVANADRKRSTYRSGRGIKDIRGNGGSRRCVIIYRNDPRKCSERALRYNYLS